MRILLASCLALAVVTVIVAVADSAEQSQRPRAPAQSPASLDLSRQSLLVLTDDWNAAAGTLQRFERATGGPWRAVGRTVLVVVGRNGLAWGVAIGMDAGSGPIKKEGDGKAPAGIFRLGTAFGQSRDKPPNLALPYRYLADDVECVDDVRSSHYNELVTRRETARPDWTSSEKMWAEPLYKRGVVVEYNSAHPVPARGSCIFLHIWKGPGSVTAGCTAMAEEDLEGVIAWLDTRKTPVLVQLPRAEYERLKTRWKLP